GPRDVAEPRHARVLEAYHRTRRQTLGACASEVLRQRDAGASPLLEQQPGLPAVGLLVDRHEIGDRRPLAGEILDIVKEVRNGETVPIAAFKRETLEVCRQRACLSVEFP